MSELLRLALALGVLFGVMSDSVSMNYSSTGFLFFTPPFPINVFANLTNFFRYLYL